MPDFFNILDNPVAGAPSESGRAIFAGNQWGYWSCGSSGSQLRDAGTLESISEIDTNSAELDLTDGVAFQQSTGAVIDTDATLISDRLFRLEQRPITIIKWQLLSVADIRFFSGLIDSGSNGVDLDTLIQQAVGIQFSTSRPDTNFQFLARNGGSQILVDSGIAADTNIHYTKIDAVSGTNVIISLLDSNFVVQASTTFTTDLPSVTQALTLASSLRTLAATVKSINQFYATILLRNS